MLTLTHLNLIWFWRRAHPVGADPVRILAKFWYPRIPGRRTRRVWRTDRQTDISMTAICNASRSRNGSFLHRDRRCCNTLWQYILSVLESVCHTRGQCLNQIKPLNISPNYFHHEVAPVFYSKYYGETPIE